MDLFGRSSGLEGSDFAESSFEGTRVIFEKEKTGKRPED
jgi:hypothetical protein